MARRKKTSPLEDVLDLLAMLPWWVCMVLAAVSYFLLHRLAAPIQASDIQGQGGAMVGAMMQKAVIHGLATAGQYIVPLLCLAAAALSAWRRKQRQTLVSDVVQARNADALDGMSWREFELLVGEAYRLQGYRVTEIGGGGPDGGVDLVLAKGCEKFFVQCKQWKAYKVGVTTVRELYGVMAAKGATGGFVVTSGRFTADAKDFAQGRNIELIDGPRLFAMIQRARQTQSQPATAPREAPSTTGSSEAHARTAALEPSVVVKAAPNLNARAVVPPWRCAPLDRVPIRATRFGDAQPTQSAVEHLRLASFQVANQCASVYLHDCNKTADFVGRSPCWAFCALVSMHTRKNSSTAARRRAR